MFPSYTTVCPLHHHKRSRGWGAVIEWQIVQASFPLHTPHECLTALPRSFQGVSGANRSLPAGVCRCGHTSLHALYRAFGAKSFSKIFPLFNTVISPKTSSPKVKPLPPVIPLQAQPKLQQFSPSPQVILDVLYRVQLHDLLPSLFSPRACATRLPPHFFRRRCCTTLPVHFFVRRGF